MGNSWSFLKIPSGGNNEEEHVLEHASLAGPQRSGIGQGLFPEIVASGCAPSTYKKLWESYR